MKNYCVFSFCILLSCANESISQEEKIVDVCYLKSRQEKFCVDGVARDKVDFDEFVTLNKTGINVSQESLKQIFDRYDLNDDGYVEVREIKSLLRNEK